MKRRTPGGSMPSPTTIKNKEMERKMIKNGIIINGTVYEAVAVDDITSKCCTGCAFEHNHGDCPNLAGKYLQRKMNVGIIFKKVEEK